MEQGIRSELEINILKGKICPYCFNPSEKIDSSYVYGRSYGDMFICKPCDAYVGTHKRDGKPLGRLANKELREAKKEAHHHFDQLWKRKIINNIWKDNPDFSERKKAYAWLSKKMNIEKKYCHIGMFDVEQCKKVVKISKKALQLCG